MKYPFLMFIVLFAGSNLWGQEASQPPNIIFLMIDDCSAVEFSCYATDKHLAGNQTPVVDALAEAGIRFTTCWATPLCMPTRALLMSGKYGCKTGVYGNKLNKFDSRFATEHIPISKALQAKGYETAISGKWHLPGYAAQPEYGWDTYSLLGGYMTPYKKDIVWDGLWFSWSKASHTFYDKAVIGKNKGKYPALYWHGAVIENGELLPSDANTYAPDLCQAFALDFIRKKRNKPFFLYYPMVLPHDPWFGTPHPKRPGQRTKPGFSSLIQRVEYYVDELVKTLKQAGLYENTILFFTGDNATLKNGKGCCSEFGVRVPLIVAGGPVKAKGVTDVMVDFSDMYPTMMECAQLDVGTSDGLDGTSFYPLLAGKSFAGREQIFSYLDMERTVRSKAYMMDGSGGIWRCSVNGNILDYQAQVDNEKVQRVRSDFMRYIDQFPIPTAEEFGQKRICSASRDFEWPSHHPTMVRAVKDQDTWKLNERRLQE